MNGPDFGYQYDRYLVDARAAREQDVHHDQRRELFLNFLGSAFDIDLSQVEREQYIQLRGQQVKMAGTARIRKGWIDAIFRDLIFEFKRDLKRELADGLRELKDYLSNTPDGDRCVGLLTDGLKFTAYVLDDAEPNGLREVDALDLEKSSAQVAQSWLDAYLLRQRSVMPTSADIVSRFGLRSPTFAAAAHILREALAVFSKTEAGAAEVKRQQWAFYLARVYGSADASNDEMFVRHTYLCQFAKILAYAAYFSAGDAASNVEDILSGQGFQVLGISNVGEEDFFAWVLAPEVKGQTLAAFAQIAASLAVYDLSKINEDLLKQLYQNLVEPETRHELGEFYTPDWLAELTLRDIEYGPNKSLLDPACGSGTFLFTALRRLAEQGLMGEALVRFALENVMGMDVHPLAVTIARINYMLAIVPHLRQSQQREQRPVPIFMANSLQRTSKAGPVGVIEVQFDKEKQRVFQIPQDAATKPTELQYVLGEMQRRAKSEAANWPNVSVGQFGEFAAQHLLAKSAWNELGYVQTAWNTNLKYLAEQIARGRDSIWVYVMRNTSQPQVLQHRKFDVVAGNPPWIAYRYLKDPSYREDVKELTRAYGLLETGDVKLNTQMELSTLFFEHCSRVYLKAGGTIAFVMPRSVITGAKQHRAFQQKGFSRVLDLKGVAPLFNVETCVMIRQPGALLTGGIPSTRYSGKLPAHECRWSVAEKALDVSDGTVDFAAESEIASPYYHPRFKQGATLVPRNLVFVTSAQPGLQPDELAHTTIMKTDPDVDAEAKAPWKGLSLQGHIDDAFLYATLLSKNLVPFGIRRLHLVALPVRADYPQQLGVSDQGPEKRFIPMSLAEMRDSIKYGRSADDWFAKANGLWEKHRKSPDMSLWDRLNFQQGVVAQSAEPGYVVVYNAAGSNLSASILATGELPIVGGVQPKAFVTEHKMYWFNAKEPEEAHYLAAVLNAPCVDVAIKPFQTRGIYVGPRDIERRPFEVCPIPEFDANDPDHQRLAEISRLAHEAVAALDLREGGVVAARKKAREATRGYLDAIDAIARRMLGLAATPVAPVQETAETEAEADEEEEVEIG